MKKVLKTGAAGWRSPKTNEMPSMLISRMFDDDSDIKLYTNECERQMNDRKKENDEWHLT